MAWWEHERERERKCWCVGAEQLTGVTLSLFCPPTYSFICLALREHFCPTSAQCLYLSLFIFFPVMLRLHLAVAATI